MMVAEEVLPSAVKQGSSHSSSEDGHHTPTHSDGTPYSERCELGLKRFASSPALPFTDCRTLSPGAIQIPIVGYEVMEERARFTVFKLRIENKTYGDCWFVFRRYTDFVRLHAKLKSEFPDAVLVLPRKRWLRDNFDTEFLEERARGLQRLIDTIADSVELLASPAVRDFFCLDEPPTQFESGEETRAIFEALEETIYHLRGQLRLKESDLEALKLRLAQGQSRTIEWVNRFSESMMDCAECQGKLSRCAGELHTVYSSSGVEEKRTAPSTQ